MDEIIEDFPVQSVRISLSSDPIQLDLTGPQIVDVVVDADGKRVWINVDGICRLRICQAGRITVEDNR